MNQKIGRNATIAVVGAGTMGRGIAQIAATYGHKVLLYDSFSNALEDAREFLNYILNRQVEKERMSQQEVDDILGRIHFVEDMTGFGDCELVIEAIIEDLDAKTDAFARIEGIVPRDCIIASNTSSLSIASLSSALKKPRRMLGIHFFNPAPLMPLVEIVPAIVTSDNTLKTARNLIDNWGKTTVQAKDTPGFIVNRVARPFYGEALRIYEEGIADFATIDWAMKELGGFRMGPFELMDFIGNDINYKVTETVFEAFYYDPRYKPSFTQKRHVEAGWLGKKNDRGFYDYSDDAQTTEPTKDEQLGKKILSRIVTMLINEAADALHLKIASRDDIDLAMTKGVNYPKGLLHWADDIGIVRCLARMDELSEQYREDRYRASVLLRTMAENNETFYE